MSNQRMRELFLEKIERQRMGGDLVAGKRRKKKHTKATPAQLAALKKARAAKKRGGQFEDLGDSDYKLFGAAYKNPLEQAAKKYYNNKKDEEWNLSEGWAAYGKMAKKLNEMGAILASATGNEKYNVKAPEDATYAKYIREKKKIKQKLPYIRLLQKYGIKPTAADFDLLSDIAEVQANDDD